MVKNESLIERVRNLEGADCLDNDKILQVVEAVKEKVKEIDNI